MSLLWRWLAKVVDEHAEKTIGVKFYDDIVEANRLSHYNLYHQGYVKGWEIGYRIGDIIGRRVANAERQAALAKTIRDLQTSHATRVRKE